MLGVAHDLEVRRVDRTGEPLLLALRLVGGRTNRTRAQLFQATDFFLNLHRAGHHLCIEQDAVDRPLQALAALHNRPDVPGLIGVEEPAILGFQQFAHAQHPRDRRAQLVADGSQEGVLARVGPAQLCHHLLQLSRAGGNLPLQLAVCLPQQPFQRPVLADVIGDRDHLAAGGVVGKSLVDKQHVDSSAAGARQRLLDPHLFPPVRQAVADGIHRTQPGVHIGRIVNAQERQAFRRKFRGGQLHGMGLERRQRLDELHRGHAQVGFDGRADVVQRAVFAPDADGDRRILDDQPEALFAVAQLQFRQLAHRDVGIGAHHAPRRALRIPGHRFADASMPAHLARLGDDAVLAGIVGTAALQIIVKNVVGSGCVVGVQGAGPEVDRSRDFVRIIAKQPMPLVIAKYFASENIPIPQPFAGGIQRPAQPLLAGAQRILHALLRRNIDCVNQQAGAFGQFNNNCRNTALLGLARFAAYRRRIAEQLPVSPQDLHSSSAFCDGK